MSDRLWIVPGLLTSLWVTASGQVPFKAGVEAVRVDVLVTRGGQPVQGLTPRDFQVRDNGILQEIDHAAFEEIPLNVVLVLDGSDSVKGDRERHLRTASGGLLDSLRADDQAALINFGGSVIVRSSLTSQLARVRSALEDPLPLGDTSLVDAAYAALVAGESQPGRALVIVFTDGVEVSSFLDADTAIEAARRSDCVVYGVTLTNGGKPSFLRDLSDASGGELLEIASTSDLGTTFLKLLDQFRHRYLLSYTPQGVERQGWHRLQVRVARGGVTVKARPGYNRD
jgi:VWFA-related protein